MNATQILVYVVFFLGLAGAFAEALARADAPVSEKVKSAAALAAFVIAAIMPRIQELVRARAQLPARAQIPPGRE